MRLTCPNCGAEYEVDASAIPETGRDVQCSNCGHAWFQLPPDVEAAREAEAEVFDEPPPLAVESAADAPRPALAGGLSEEEGEDEGEGDEPPVSRPAAAAPRDRQPRTLDETVLAVLREEAEREAVARRAEALRTIETQPELGLDSAVAGAVAASAAAERAVREKAREVEVIPSAEEIAIEAGLPPPSARPGSRRELLPDIEEINSTLRAARDRSEEEDLPPADETPARPGRSGFRSGFVLMLVLAAALVFTYGMAPRLSQQIPGAAPALGAYVETVDGLRLWLDGLIRQATGAVEEASPAAPPQN